MEENKVNPPTGAKPKWSAKKNFKNGCILLLATTLGYIHYRYVSQLFENNLSFSYLSNLEREMALRTEMGFYYSYYKTVVTEQPYIAGITKIMYDRTVEYPKEVNAFNRFNIHPEVVIGSVYRYFEPWLNTTKYRQCSMVHRGDDIPPVESCNGIGEPILFYLEAVWLMAGLMVAAIFLHASLLSETVLGGLLAVVQYFANHSECTRVMWAPNERENLAAPLLFVQAWLLTAQLRDRRKLTAFHMQISIFIINCICLLFWQFTQFIFLTQTAIFFAMEQFKIIDLKTLCIFLHSHFCGLHMAVLLLQGNDMLKTSLYTSFFLVVSAYCLFFSSLRIKVQNRVDLFVESWLVFLRMLIIITTSVYLKEFISDLLEAHEDSHVWDILYSKFFDYKTFHTLIYTCSNVFDFLPMSTFVNLTKTMLMPTFLVVSAIILHYWMWNAIEKKKRYLAVKKEKVAEVNKVGGGKKEKKMGRELDQEDEDSGIENNAETVKHEARTDLDVMDKKTKVVKKEEFDDLVRLLRSIHIDPAVLYNIVQTLVFGVLAVLVMRLKLLFATQMCIVCSLVLNPKYYKYVNVKWRPLQWVAWAASAGLLAERLYANISEETSHVGEFSDLPQEQLLEWIMSKTSAGAAFAGSMPVLASVLLSTRRPIVAHPHYEHWEARERAYAVYKAYGRFSAQELYQELTKLKVTYYIIERKYCYGRSSKNCTFADIWDVESPAYTGRPKLCHTLLTEPADHLYRVYGNQDYAVFRVHDMSVRYMPRCFDT